MAEELKGRGHTCSENRVARLMREHDLRAQVKPRFVPCTTDSQHDQPIAPNRLAERAAPDGPNQVWLQDITYVPTAQGWLFLALVMDLWSRKILPAQHFVQVPWQAPMHVRGAGGHHVELPVERRQIRLR
jgi:transposase InsO family protein